MATKQYVGGSVVIALVLVSDLITIVVASLLLIRSLCSH